MAADRWATFDCYGTLIDWNGGIRRELARLFGPERAPALLARYHDVEPALQSERPDRSYREVLTLALERIATEQDLELADGERDALARSLPSWEPFPEVRAALRELIQRRWRLAILSNSDRDLIDASIAALGVPFELAIVAGEIGSYKPAHGHWERFFATAEADRASHVHVAASLFHDIAPASELGLKSVWINRLDESAGPAPTRELSDLSQLPEALDALVPG